MRVNENINFNGQVIVKDANGVDIQVMYLSATLDSANMSVNINATTSNKELVAANADSVKAQYAEFETTVKTKATALGFVIF